MKITQIKGREIFDSRGIPTLECIVVLNDELYVTSSVPAGMSVGNFEAVELRDGGNRLMGKGVHKAIEQLEHRIAPLFIGKEPDLVGMDLAMIELDGTETKSHLGSNTTLAVSMAICRAQAVINEMELYEFIATLSNLEAVTLPFPLVNIINGGAHADNGLAIQEFMIMPIGATSFRQSLEISVEIFYTLKKLLRSKGKSLCVGDEGGFAPDVADEQEALDLIMEAVALAGLSNGEEVVLALDVAAHQFYDQEKNMYLWKGQYITGAELVEYFVQLTQQYPIYSLEDPLSEDDPESWQQLMARIGGSLQLVGDDLFATHPLRIARGAQERLANSVIIKPNQIGTITETLQAIKVCKDEDMNVIISHRSGETEDTFIVDLAVGTSAGQIKLGGCSRGERMVKYNHLLQIEDELTGEL